MNNNSWFKKEKPLLSLQSMGGGAAGLMISGAEPDPVAASGGTKSYPGNGYIYHVFTSSGSLVVTQGKGAEYNYLAVGGGAGGVACRVARRVGGRRGRGRVGGMSALGCSKGRCSPRSCFASTWNRWRRPSRRQGAGSRGPTRAARCAGPTCSFTAMTPSSWPNRRPRRRRRATTRPLTCASVGS